MTQVFDEIHLLFEDRLSNKFYFRTFTHVLGCYAITNLQHKHTGEIPGEQLSLYFPVEHYWNNRLHIIQKFL